MYKTIFFYFCRSLLDAICYHMLSLKNEHQCLGHTSWFTGLSALLQSLLAWSHAACKKKRQRAHFAMSGQAQQRLSDRLFSYYTLFIDAFIHYFITSLRCIDISTLWPVYATRLPHKKKKKTCEGFTRSCHRSTVHLVLLLVSVSGLQLTSQSQNMLKPIGNQASIVSYVESNL